jgi:hypothetical protein
MSTRPPGPPAPEPSNRDKIKSALDELMQQKKEEQKLSKADVAARKQRDRQKSRRRYMQAALLFVILAASTALAIPRWNQPFRPPEGERAEQDVRKAMVFAASLVDTYERRSGRLPGNFSQVGVALPGISYMRTGESWLLTASVNGHNLAFRKGDDTEAFLRPH